MSGSPLRDTWINKYPPGGSQKKGARNMTDEADLEKLREVAQTLTDNDFAMLPDDGNELTLDAADFPQLFAEGEGSQVMLVIKGRVSQCDGEMGTICIDAFDAALIHGANPEKRKPKLGTGERFAQLKAKLGHKLGVFDPAGLAAFIGRKKYGKGKFQAMATRGRTGNW